MKKDLWMILTVAFDDQVALTLADLARQVIPKDFNVLLNSGRWDLISIKIVSDRMPTTQEFIKLQRPFEHISKELNMTGRLKYNYCNIEDKRSN